MLRVLLKARLQALLYGLSGAGKTDRFGRARNSKAGLVIVAIAFPMLFLTYLFLLLQFFGLLAEVTSAMQLEWLHFAAAAAVAAVLSVFGSVFSTQSQLFDAKDNELLLSMPVKPRDILLSRLVLVYLLNLVFSALVMIPCGISALAQFVCTPLGIVGFVLAILLLPLLSTAICCLLGWLLSLLTAKMSNKAIMNTLMTVVFLVVFYLVYFRFLNLVNNEDGQSAELLLSLLPKLESTFSQFLAPFCWFGKLFAEGNVLCGIGALLVTVLPMVLAVALLSRSFFKIAMSESGAKKRVYQRSPLRVSGLRWALVKKELKHFVSSSVYMTNCGLGLIMLLGASVFLLVRRDLAATLTEALTAMGAPEGTETIVAVLAICFFGFCNTMTAPSVSLEGRSRWIVQSIPADLSHVIFAKVDMQLLLTVPVLLVASAAAAICFRLNGPALVLVLLVPQILNLLTALSGVWLNLLMPKYNWSSENVPVKQSAPVAIEICGTMFGVMLLAFVYFAFLRDVLSPYVMLAVCGGLAAVLCAVLWLWLRKNAARKFLSDG